jgi:hypothetical protein
MMLLRGFRKRQEAAVEFREFEAAAPTALIIRRSASRRTCTAKRACRATAPRDLAVDRHDVEDRRQELPSWSVQADPKKLNAHENVMHLDQGGRH